MWTTAAPASKARRASSAISAGVYGTHGHWSRLASTPVSAQVTITLSDNSAPLEVRFALLEKRRHAFGGVLGLGIQRELRAERLELLLVRQVLGGVERTPAQA